MDEKYLLNYLRQGESLDEEIDLGGGLYRRIVVRNLKRLSHKTKEFTYANQSSGEVPQLLRTQRWTKATVAKLHTLLGSPGRLLFEDQLYNWLASGWLVRLDEFKDYGAISANTLILPSPALLAHWRADDDKLSKLRSQEIRNYLRSIKGLSNPYGHVGFDAILAYAATLAEESQALTKQHEFFAALLTAASQSAFYDWKEIGTYAANAHSAHAPSKLFDAQRAQYVEILNQILDDDTSSIGLATVPGDYDLNFAAACTIGFTFGNFSYNRSDCISKLTPDQVAKITEIKLQKITTVFATENRSVIRKLVYGLPHEKREHLALIGFDGQVRTPVYRFLERLRDAGANHLIVWSDYDNAAKSMLTKLSTLGFAQLEIMLGQSGDLRKADLDSALAYLDQLDVSLIEQETQIKNIATLAKLLGVSND